MPLGFPVDPDVNFGLGSDGVLAIRWVRGYLVQIRTHQVDSCELGSGPL